MENMDIINIPKEKFQFVSGKDNSLEKKLVTKPRGYFQDAMSRFCKNKGAIVGAIVIFILFLYACFGSLLTPYSVAYNDPYFIKTLPKCELFAQTNFWDGCEDKTFNKETFDYYYYIGEETGHNAIKDQKYTKTGNLYNVRLDSYQVTGCVSKKVEKDEYLNIQQYQNETGIQVLYPIVSKKDRPSNKLVGQDMIGNYYYKSYTIETATLFPFIEAIR